MIGFGSQMMSLNGLLPELAADETAAVTVKDADCGVNPGTYTFLELYCRDKKCDCQRAMIRVLSANGDWHATLSYGWRDLKFYVAWMYGDRETAATIPGINLYTEQPQAHNATNFLDIFRHMMLDPALQQRYQRHYALFKAALKGDSPLKTITQVDLAERRKLRRRLNLKAKYAQLPARKMLPAPN